MIRYWAYLTSEEIKMMNKDEVLVILPIGATEQHGNHLPVGTDSIILSHLLESLTDLAEFTSSDILIAPLLPVGKSNEHMDYPGSLSFSTQTLYAMVNDYCSAIGKHGFKKVLLMNSHGGNTDLLNVLSRDIRIAHDMEVFVFDWWFTTFWKDILDELQESDAYGVFHACELETSLMLAYRPELVNMDKAADEFPDKQLTHQEFVSITGPITIGWKTQDVTVNGVVGAPSYATAEKGRKFIQFAVRKLQKMLIEVIKTNYRSNE